MCGDGFASPEMIAMRFRGYAPRGGVAAKITRASLSESQRLSAHQAAKPQDPKVQLAHSVGVQVQTASFNSDVGA
jgi:hypothetical protein